MAKDPAFLFYSNDFLSGTLTMSHEDRGKYIYLLCIMHQQGRQDEETIRFLVGSVSDKLRLKFGIDESGLWFNKRLEEEIEKRTNFIESRKSNGKLGGRPKASAKPIGKPNGEASEKLIENINENEVDSQNYIYISDEKVFSIFDHLNRHFKLQIPNWQDLYPKGNIKEASERFMKERAFETFKDDQHFRSAFNLFWGKFNSDNGKRAKVIADEVKLPDGLVVVAGNLNGTWVDQHGKVHDKQKLTL